MTSLCRREVHLPCGGCILLSNVCMLLGQKKGGPKSKGHHNRLVLGMKDIHVVVEGDMYAWLKRR